MGKLISIEGNDGSGKNTQAIFLVQKLCSLGMNAKMLSFPRYGDHASVFVTNYLNGVYDKDPNNIDPTIASTFYSLDRYDSFYGLEKMIDFYNQEDSIIVCDRYTSSNLIHQIGRVEQENRGMFIQWLEYYEYGVLKIPKPDIILFLHMSVGKSLGLMNDRGREKDIHENKVFLETSYQSAVQLAKLLDWTVINCESGNELKSPQVIHEEIFEFVMGIS